MQEQWFGMYLSMLILIVMEVILMSQNGEGASTSVAKRWSKRSTGNEMETESSDTRSDQSRDQADTKKTSGRGKRWSINVNRNPPMKNRRWWRSNEDTTNLQPNDSRSSFDSQNHLDHSSAQVANSLMELENIGDFNSNSLKTKSSRSAVTFVLDTMLSVLCRLVRQVVYQLEPYTSVSNLILKVILHFINLVTPYVKENSPELAEEPKNPIQKLIDFFNPFKSTGDSKKPSQSGNDKGIILSIVDYFNPYKQTSESEKFIQSLHEPLDLLELFVDIVKPLTSATNMREISQSDDDQLVPSVAKKRDNFRKYTDSSELSHPHINSEVPYYFDKDPFTILGSPILPPLLNSRSVSPSPESNYNRRSAREANDCPRIPNHYHKVEKIHRAYKLHIINLKWKEAREKCRSEGAEIAWPDNQSQYDIIIEYAKRMLISTDLYFYIGYNRSLPEEIWTTVYDGVLNFGNLANATTVEDPMGKQCGGLHVSKDNHGEFTNVPCESPLPFMCEIIIAAECV